MFINNILNLRFLIESVRFVIGFQTGFEFVSKPDLKSGFSNHTRKYSFLNSNIYKCLVTPRKSITPRLLNTIGVIASFITVFYTLYLMAPQRITRFYTLHLFIPKSLRVRIFVAGNYIFQNDLLRVDFSK